MNELILRNILRRQSIIIHNQKQTATLTWQQLLFE